MTIIRSGLTTLHVTCQKIFGLWPTINSMSLLNLFGSNKRGMQCQLCVYESVHRRPTWTFISCRLCMSVFMLRWISLNYCITIRSFSLKHSISVQNILNFSHIFTAFISSVTDTQIFSTFCFDVLPHYKISCITLSLLKTDTLCVQRSFPSFFPPAVISASFINNNNKIIRQVYDSVRLYSSVLSHMLVSACEYAFNVNVNMLICLCLLRFLNKLPLTCLCHRCR